MERAKNASEPNITSNSEIKKSESIKIDIESDEVNSTLPLKDRGWAWLIVIASFLSHALNDGVIYSYGVLTTEYVNHFQISRLTVGLMGSLLAAITLLVGPLASYLCNRFSYRSVAVVGSLICSTGFAAPYFYRELWFIIVCSSIICGIGFGLVYLPSIMIISMWFDKKRSLATGIVVSGSGIGTFAFSAILESLIVNFGWQLTMLITGGILLLLVPCSLTYIEFNSNGGGSENDGMGKKSFTTKDMSDDIDISSIKIDKDIENGCPEIKENQDCKSESKNSMKIILKNPIFIIFLVSNVLTSIGFNAPYMFVKDRAIEYQIGTIRGSFLISSIGIGNCIGRIGSGYLAGLSCVNQFHLFNFSLIMSGISLIVSWGISNYYLMVAYTICYGITSGAFVALTPVILVDIFGLDVLDITFSVCLIFQGIAVLAGPPFVGWIYDATLSFNISFVVCGMIIAISGLIMYFSYISKDFRKKKFTS